MRIEFAATLFAVSTLVSAGDVVPKASVSALGVRIVAAENVSLKAGAPVITYWMDPRTVTLPLELKLGVGL